MVRTDRLPADLSAFLAAGAATPFAWGRCDCLLWLADWVAIRLRRPVGYDWRGRYATATACGLILARAGGLDRLMAAETSALGLVPTQAPATGDIGVVVDGGARLIGAIRVGDRWAAKGQSGVVLAPFAYQSAWSVPDA